LKALDEYQDILHTAIKNITAEQLQKLTHDTSSLTMDAVSHKICGISRRIPNDIRSLPMVSPITSSVRSRLANQFRFLEQSERIHLYKLFSKVPGSRATAGVFFEAAAQQHLQGGADLELVQMVRLPKSRGGTLPRWHSGHSLIKNASLEKLRQQALRQKFTIAIRPSQTIEYHDAGLSHISQDILYVPESDNQVAIDSFIVVGDILYLFQFTIALEHDIKPGLITFLGKCQGLPPMDNWCFVFVVPPNSSLIAPQPWSLQLRKLRPYTSVIQLAD